MARFNEILAGRFNRAVQKLLSMKGPASLVTVSDEMFPIYPFQAGVEDHYLQGFSHFALAQTIAPGAGATGALQLRNPTASGVLAVVESILLTSASVEFYLVTTANQFTAGGSPADLASVFVGGNSDSRGPTLSSSVPSTSATTTTSLATNDAFVRVAASTTLELISHQDQEIVLGPSSAIRIQTQTNAQASQISIRWRERALEDSEKT